MTRRFVARYFESFVTRAISLSETMRYDQPHAIAPPLLLTVFNAVSSSSPW
jgi:hypothetical protein